MSRFLPFILLCVVSLALSTCSQPTTSGAESAEEVSVAPSDVAVDDSFGARFTAATVVPAQELTSRFGEQELQDTVRTTLQGQVNEVCQAKGCWMTIAAGGEEEMMVKFKDYGFFMPKDISGREVVMNGMAYYQITPVDELRHYAEDAGKSAEEIAMITEPRKELRFLADGVQLLK